MRFVAKFQHKKSGNIIEVNVHYQWSSDTFYATYLGRKFEHKGDTPYIGKNWKYLNMV